MRTLFCVVSLWVSAACAVTLQWNVPADLAGIDGYEIHYGESSGAYTLQQDAPGATTNTAIVTNPPLGDTYYYAARSRSADGSLVSAFSNEVVLAQGPAVPDAPANVSVVYTRQEDTPVAARYWVASTTQNHNTTTG